MIEIRSLTRKNWASYSASLQELENTAEYPYGSDFFKISHGPSYFNFFERMGEPVFHIAIEENKVVACASGVLRRFPKNSSVGSSWYLCDLKVHPDFRDKRIPSKLFRKSIFLNYLRCGRAYAVSMNPADRENRVIAITQKFPFFPIILAAELNIFSLESDSLEKIVGPISYLSLCGKKDLLMKSTNKPMKLIHIQHGPFAERQLGAPEQNAKHMICSPRDSALDRFLRANFAASATASILAHRMSGIDWSFILTSDI
jgi:hypothetical protein